MKTWRCSSTELSAKHLSSTLTIALPKLYLTACFCFLLGILGHDLFLDASGDAGVNLTVFHKPPDSSKLELRPGIKRIGWYIFRYSHYRLYSELYIPYY